MDENENENEKEREREIKLLEKNGTKTSIRLNFK